MDLDRQSKREDYDESAASLGPGLFLVATPIGAANDISLRALDALRRADVIAAEDTRRAQKLMSIHGVARAGRPIIPYHDHNGASQRPGLLARIERGASVVCVSDAGTPLIADPGWRLAKEAIEAGFAVRALPGASALLAALSVSGLPTDRFMFAGFPPPKASGRRKLFEDLKTTPATLVFYESPRRLADFLADAAEVFGARDAAVSRELTKRHEETRRGPLADLAAQYDGPPPKGEIVVCIGPPGAAEAPDEAAIDDALREALKTERSKDAARLVADRFGLSKRDVYARALSLKDA